MCMTCPGRVVSVDGDIAEVDVAGKGRRVPLTLLHADGTEVGPGDWLALHAGLAVARIDESEAAALTELIRTARGEGP